MRNVDKMNLRGAEVRGTRALPGIALVAMLIAVDGHTEVRDCESVSAGLAEPVVFSARRKDGERVDVEALLRRPTGKGRLPALVIAHGSGGLRPPRCYDGAIELFTRWGFVTLLVDSQSDTFPSGRRRYDYSFEEQAYHAYGAAAFLASVPYVDADRIGIAGWSKGGAAVLVAVSALGNAEIGNGARFRAAAAIYPLCLGTLGNLRTPLLVLIGEDDEQVPASSCEDMEVIRTADVEYQLRIYPGARHLFDASWSTNYDPATAKDAEERQRRFFTKYLQR